MNSQKTTLNLQLWSEQPETAVQVDVVFDVYHGDGEQPGGIDVTPLEVRANGSVIAKADDPRGWQWDDLNFVRAINSHFDDREAFISLQYKIRRTLEEQIFNSPGEP